MGSRGWGDRREEEEEERSGIGRESWNSHLQFHSTLQLVHMYTIIVDWWSRNQHYSSHQKRYKVTTR